MFTLLGVCVCGCVLKGVGSVPVHMDASMFVYTFACVCMRVPSCVRGGRLCVCVCVCMHVFLCTFVYCIETHRYACVWDAVVGDAHGDHADIRHHSLFDDLPDARQPLATAPCLPTHADAQRLALAQQLTEQLEKERGRERVVE